MSSGSLDLATTMCGSLFDYGVDRDYKHICNNANARIARNLNPMYDRELSELIVDVICLIDALESYKYGDIVGKTYIECANKFKKKWMHRTEKDRLNSYLDDLKSYYEELAEELKGE